MSEAILKAENLRLSFDGFAVLDNLSLVIARGELRFLIGPNGAGKTTFMDVISGKVRPDSGRVLFDPTVPASGDPYPSAIEIHGEIRFEGLDLTRMSEDAIVRAGIARKFQTPSVFNSLSVARNLAVAAAFRDRFYRHLLPTPRERRERIAEALDTVGLSHRADVLAGALSHGERQWLEIAMLLVQSPRVLLLDEPIAGMTREERERTGELLHRLAGAHTILITEHDMDFVRQFARTVTVLHQGRVLREGTIDEIQQDPVVQQVYLGRQHTIAGAAS
ncbi:ABC transporter ATP-binding protein [Tepidiforma sp.]|uniref:ABC transporter ATP-binding protein n=1 Tax=Tepidiforma sp. TaxID=2682230 RepID=UPI002ADDE0FF|nr:ATP-binding cassette domain-containing protein [Tepidiforma sp.]